MTQAYDTLMDNLAALAVEAMRMPVTAVQSYWLLLAARPDTAGLCLTSGALLQPPMRQLLSPYRPGHNPLPPGPWSTYGARGDGGKRQKH